jgi:hypothetical protein
MLFHKHKHHNIKTCQSSYKLTVHLHFLDNLGVHKEKLLRIRTINLLNLQGVKEVRRLTLRERIYPKTRIILSHHIAIISVSIKAECKRKYSKVPVPFQEDLLLNQI